MKKGHRAATEVKAQIITCIKNEGVSVQKAAKEHRLHKSAIYRWLEKKITGTSSVLEIAKLRREHDEPRVSSGRLPSSSLHPKKEVTDRLDTNIRTRALVLDASIHPPLQKRMLQRP